MTNSSFRVAVGAGYWSLSGVHVFAVHLVRGLRERGIDAHLLMTEQNTELVSLPTNPMDIPKDIPVVELPVPREGNWAAHWHCLIQYLEGLKPCIYLPNVDFRHSCVSPKLSSGVPVVGILQGDDPIHYEHVQRLGKYWDAIVCVSQELADRTAAIDPAFRSRIHMIPNAVPVPDHCPPRAWEEKGRLKIVYHGVLNTYQKRILDIPLILEELQQRGVPMEMTIAGTGPEQEELLRRCAPFIESGTLKYHGIVKNDEIQNLLSRHDVYILTSRFEGMPHAMLEAMACGCVPVVTDIASGIPQVVRQGENGYRIPIGGIAEFADALASLQADPGLRRKLALAAHRTVKDSPYNVTHMVAAYANLFERVMHDARTRAYRRPRASVLPPPATVDGLSIFPVEHKLFVEEVDRLLPNGDTDLTPESGTLWGGIRRALRRLGVGGSVSSGSKNS
ncbi:MAG: glycosyltransferase family 4 protein [Planctomycetota bacterium]